MTAAAPMLLTGSRYVTGAVSPDDTPRTALRPALVFQSVENSVPAAIGRAPLIGRVADEAAEHGGEMRLGLEADTERDLHQ